MQSFDFTFYFSELVFLSSCTKLYWIIVEYGSSQSSSFCNTYFSIEVRPSFSLHFANALFYALYIWYFYFEGHCGRKYEKNLHFLLRTYHEIALRFREVGKSVGRKVLPVGH